MNRIAELRKAKGYSQQALADKVGCRRETIANLEKGRYNPSLELADRVALFLDCTIYDVFSLMTSATEREQRLECEKRAIRDTMRNVCGVELD